MTSECCELSRSGTEPANTFFTIFVDWIFTSSIERPFTNVFDVVAALSAATCLCRACNAD